LVGYKLDRQTNFAVLNLIMAVLVMVSACAHQSPKSTLAEPKPANTVANEQPRVPDEYLVTLAPDADKGIITEYYGRYGIKDIYALGGETYLLVLLNDPGPASMVILVDEDDRVMAVQPNLVYWDNRSGSITK
jgi:hypothetical protein